MRRLNSNSWWFVVGIIDSFHLMQVRGNWNPCNEFTLGKCDIPPAYFDQWTITENSGKCQEFCIEHACVTFQYTSDTKNCTLMKEDYRQVCKTVGLPNNTFYSDCIINDGPYCDRFIEEECEYRGKIVYRPKIGSITDFDHCAQMCKIYKSSNCNYWVYHEAWLECILFDTSERVCKSISGPEHPDIKGCKETSNITTTTEAATTEETTTTTEESSTSWEKVIHPDPENCQNYYLCDPPDICTLESCDPDLLFDDILLTCNFAKFVDCGDRPNPLETTINPEKSTTTNSNPTTSNENISTTTKISTSITTTEKKPSYQCNDLILGSCHLDESNIFYSVHENNITLCMMLCEIDSYPECKSFLYHTNSNRCDLLNVEVEDYIQRCDHVGASDDTLKNCLSDSNKYVDPCKGIMESDCQFHGNILDEKRGINSEDECFKRKLNEENAKYFFFEREFNICQVLDSSDRECHIYRGPRSLSHCPIA